jgi:aminocarboxymuconate-semialdehyde decarboxylase
LSNLGKAPSEAAIDIHSHVVPADFPRYLGKHADARWPQTQAGHDCRHRNIVIDGKVFRTVADECWNVDRRLEMMSRAGLSRQVLSPMPELLSYWLATEDACSMARYINDCLAEMVARAPDRLSALAMVPLQEPDLAARELEVIMRLDPFRGVEIGTHVNGTPLGHPRFAPFFAAAEELGAAVFVHALHPIGIERLVGPPSLANIVAHPCETALAIVSLITGGVLERHPKLRLAFSHGGGAFGLVLPRLTHFWSHREQIAALTSRSPADLARQLYYDTLVYDAQALRYLAERFGVTQLCIGTDQPFAGSELAPVESLAQFNEGERQLLRVENARRFLGEA